MLKCGAGLVPRRQPAMITAATTKAAEAAFELNKAGIDERWRAATPMPRASGEAV